MAAMDAEKFNPKMNEVMGNLVWSRSAKVTEFEKEMGRNERFETFPHHGKRYKCPSAALVQLDLNPGDESSVPLTL